MGTTFNFKSGDPANKVTYKMSKNIDRVPVTKAKPKMVCSECGKVAETRPYEHNGAEICYICAEKLFTAKAKGDLR